MENRIDELRERLRDERDPAGRLPLLSELSRRIAPTDPHSAYPMALEALEIARDLDDQVNIARCLNTIGLARMHASEFEQALEPLEESLRMCRRMGVERGVIDSLALIGNVMARMARYDRARESLSQAIELCRASGDQERLVALRNSLAVICYRTGDYVAALDMHRQNLDHLESVGNLRRVATVLANIVSIYDEIGSVEEGRATLERVLKIQREIGDHEGETLTLVNLSNGHIRAGRFGEAERYTERAVEMAREFKGSRIEVLTMCNRSRLLLARDEHAEALEQAFGAVALASSRSMSADHVEALLLVARIRLDRDEYPEAIDTLVRAREIALEIGDPASRADASQMLARAYEGIGDPTEALRTYREFMELKESLVGEENRKSILSLEVRYGTERAEREREMFRLRSEKLEAENSGNVRELTALAMSLTQTMEVLRGLRENAVALARSEEEDAKDRAETMIRMVDSALQGVNGWQQFERQFNLLHPEFIGKLSGRFPDLTSTELKICLLLRINLSTKEISVLLNVSTRAVEGHRYNIRRKFALPSKVSLSTFLSSI